MPQRQVPMKLAMGMLLTARRLPPAQAATMGLINEGVSADQLDAAVERWGTHELDCAPLSVRAIKQTIRHAARLMAAEARATRLPAVIEAPQSEDGEEGVPAVGDKRPPEWCGR
jgi:crotonobetainyl-CoA hydratase